MSQRSQVPRGLRLVGLLFFLEGLAALVTMGLGLFQRQVPLDLNVLGIPTSFGLARFSRGWRTWALINLWISMLMSPIVAACSALGHGMAVSVPGTHLVDVSPAITCAAVTALFFLFVWEYRTLTRDDVRVLFRAGEYGRAEPRTPPTQADPPS
jgi:hypothetical protein